ncbi:cysteine-rich secretory protein 2-like [Macrobrachium rosenbergii]|uniref:cysteine-rich secretory protein 2-like n=1 Tax=Macrobrachium rosenbergii TaxID=79674 RepID=UPI0034D5A407
MLFKLTLLLVFMAGFISRSLSSHYTLPVAVPLRFDLPGGFVDVRAHSANGNGTARNNNDPRVGEDESDYLLTQDDDGSNGKKKKKQQHKQRIFFDDDDEYDSLLMNHAGYAGASKWHQNANVRRRNRNYNRANYTSRQYPKKNNAPNVRRIHNKGRAPKYPTNRKSNAPNRPTGGRPAGGRYRSVDPRQKKVQRHILRFHNILRSHVEPPAADMLAVGWYETAAEQAQAWAEQCGTHTNYDHPSVRWTSRYGACGQNVLVASRKRRWSYVLRRWWSGKRYFKFGGDINNSSIVAAYTQMAWYNSHQVGCGFSECTTTAGITFFRYVCNYCPSGNDPRRISRPYTQGQTCRRCPNSCRSMCSKGQCKLCTNACTYSDLWVNCAMLDKKWHEWLCNTKTTKGVERFKNCRATCQCLKRIT